MMITIRNKRILNWLGFERAPGCTSMLVGMSLRLWLGVIRRRFFDARPPR